MTRPACVYEVELRNIFSPVVCVFLIASETPSFAVETDRAAVAIERREGVTIGGGDGSSFDKAIIVHAASLPQALLAGFEYIALRYGWFQISSVSPTLWCSGPSMTPRLAYRIALGLLLIAGRQMIRPERFRFLNAEQFGTILQCLRFYRTIAREATGLNGIIPSISR